MAKNQIRILKSSKKRDLRLIKKLKKARLKRAFVRVLRFRGKSPKGSTLCALRLSALFTTLLATKSESKK